MDPILLFHLEKIRACPHTGLGSDRVELDFACADALDYLGKRIDEEKDSKTNGGTCT